MRLLGLGLSSVLAIAASGSALAQQAIPDGDWRTINRDLASTRYSPLRDINKTNVTRLTQAWSYALKGNNTATPLVIDSTMYFPVGNRVIALDLHADAIQGFFDIPVDHLTAEKLIVDYIRKLNLPNAVIVSPDVGGAKRVGDVARLLDLPIAFVYKRRPKDDVVSEQRVVGDVDGMDAVVVDDLISTGGTLVGVSQALRAEGATSVRVLATHGVLAADAVEKLVNSPIEEIVITDSVPLPPDKQHPKIKVLSVAPLLAEAIRRVHEDRSVSELFK